MKLFVFIALISVAAAGRLEHLERAYLPPFGSNGGIGSSGSHGSFGANRGAFNNAPGFSSRSTGAFGGATLNQYLPPNHGSASNGAPGFSGRRPGAFGGATSNQYLPPNYGSASNGASQFAGSLNGFGSQKFRSQQFGGHQSAPAQQYGAPQGHSSFGGRGFQAQYPQQSAATSRQYLAPSSNSLQNPPQQAFDEQTGYQY